MCMYNIYYNTVKSPVCPYIQDQLFAISIDSGVPTFGTLLSIYAIRNLMFAQCNQLHESERALSKCIVLHIPWSVGT